jgi:hypothetical protein
MTMEKLTYFCEKCKYSTNIKHCYSSHLLSKKHNSNDITIQKCSCGKSFKSVSGLWKHKKICITIMKKNSQTQEELLLKMIENQKNMEEKQEKLENLIIEMSKNQPIPITNNNNNNNNITILNVLNNNYKDVITFEEFIKNITIDFHDIEEITDKDSCIECLNNIIIKRLKEYNVNERPFHCIQDKDDNSETFLKNNEWIKEYVKDYDDNTPILEEKVLIFIAKVDNDINNMVIDNHLKLNLKKILKNIAKNENMKRMKEEFFYGIHINKYELNHNLLDSAKNIIL